MERILNSGRPWIEPEPYEPENLNFRPEPDINDEMAIRADFVNKTPSSDTVRRRGVYRPSRDVNLIPRDQRYMLLMTYGPKSMGKFDIESPYIGFEFYGCFPTLVELEEQVISLREKNSHGVFFSFHAIDVGNGKRIQLPPPADGSAKQSHLNKEHALLIKNHLKEQVKEVDFVENRIKDSIEDVKRRNNEIEKYEEKLKNYAIRLTELSKEDVRRNRDESKKRLLSKYQFIDKEEADVALPANVENKTLREQTSTCKESLTPDQIEDYIYFQEQLNRVPNDFRYQYKILESEGKMFMVRCLQVFETNTQQF